MKVDLIFAPQHDPSLPHTALPHLKGYIKRNLGEVNVKCFDLNLEFYKSVIGIKYDKILSEFRKNYENSTDVSEAIKIALDFEKLSQTIFDKWSDVWKGYKLTLKTLDTPFNRKDINSIHEFLNSKSPFDSLFIKYILNSSANVIGITLSVEDQILPSLKLAYLIRLHRSDLTIIWGGALLSRIYPIFSQNLKMYYDYIVVREGEVPLVEILLFLMGKISSITDKRIIVNSNKVEKHIIQDFESEFSVITDIHTTGMPTYEDYPISSYWSLLPILPILSSRKCYWGKCKFCTIHQSWDNKKRKRDVVEVFTEIKDLEKKYKVKYFRFVDEASHPDFLNKFSCLVIDKGLDINFEIYGIAEKRFLKKDFVKRLSMAGCKQIYFGLESANAFTLKKMGKEINQIDRMNDIFKNCSEADIHVYVYSLFGYPLDNATDETIEYIINQTNINTAAVGSFVPVVGSRFAIENEEKLIHTYNMSEDFSYYIDSSDKKIKIKTLGKAEAKRALKEILSQRKDLAITTLLNDETRFFLSNKFGANFAQKIDYSTIDSNLKDILKKAIRQRITRG